MPAAMHSTMPTTAVTSSRRWSWAGAGLGCSLALLTQAPAYWLTHAIEKVSDQRIQLESPQGTVWNGSAQWVLNEGPHSTGHTALPTPVSWHIGPRLNFAQMQVLLSSTIASACCTPQPVRIDVSPMWKGVRIQVSDHTSHWPASWLIGLGAPWNTVQPDGQIQLQTTQLQWTQQAGQTKLQGQAEVQMQHFATRLSTLRPLGSYRVRVQGGEPITISLDTLEGSLQLQGSGQLLNGHVSFSGEATASPDTEAALSNLLNILGQRQGAKSILKMG